MTLLSNLPFWVLIALFSIIVLGATALYFWVQLDRSERKAARFGARAASAEATLAATPAGWFALSSSDGTARCSAGLARALGLSFDTAPDLAALLEALDAEDAERLAAALESLRGEGLAFTLSVRRKGQAATFEAIGTRAGGDSPGVPGTFIWFNEITRHVQRIRESEAERDAYLALLDTLPNPVWRRDSELRLEFCNQAYARAVDRDRETTLDQGIELPGAALAGASRGLASRAVSTGQTQSESHHVVVGGERRFLEISERPLGESHLAGVAFDCTAVDELRGELARHIDAHADVLEALASAIAIFGPDMRLKFFNNAYARLWRVDESLLAGEPHMNDVLEMLRERRRLPEQPNFPAYKQEQIRLYRTLIELREDLMHLPDGATLRMTATPHPFGGVLLAFEDVTDRLALERSYNTLIAVQRETLDHLYEGVAVYGADGRIKLFNPAFAKIWNLPDSFLQSEPHVRDVVPMVRDFFSIGETKWPRLMESIATRAMASGARSRRLERADGSIVEWSQVPLPDGASLFTFLDVTDSFRVERALRERNEALETTDRLKSEFIANVSYELRTPLNAIVGFSEILENQFFGELNERQLEYSRAIVESSQRLLALINDILDLATIEAGYLQLEVATFAVRPLLDSIYTLGHERARNRGIEFSIDCPDDIGSHQGDERRLKQALFNLLSNALKYTPESGRVTISARREEGELRLTVADTGIGIPHDEHVQVFGKFDRGSMQGRQSGAGLGLSLVKSLIELHGGWVELESAPERGTLVTCHIPERTPRPEQLPVAERLPGIDPVPGPDGPTGSATLESPPVPPAQPKAGEQAHKS